VFLSASLSHWIQDLFLQRVSSCLAQIFNSLCSWFSTTFNLVDLPSSMILDWSSSISFSNYCWAWKMFPNTFVFHCLMFWLNYFIFDGIGTLFDVWIGLFHIWWNWYIVDPLFDLMYVHQTYKFVMKLGWSRNNFSNMNGLDWGAKFLSHDRSIGQWSYLDNGRILMNITGLIWNIDSEIRKWFVPPHLFFQVWHPLLVWVSTNIKDLMISLNFNLSKSIHL